MIEGCSCAPYQIAATNPIKKKFAATNTHYFSIVLNYHKQQIHYT